VELYFNPPIPLYGVVLSQRKSTEASLP